MRQRSDLPPRSSSLTEAEGLLVMERALEDARRAFGVRLEAAYALGSLAHGGFSAAVSDVDVALILDRLDGDTAAAMQKVRR